MHSPPIDLLAPAPKPQRATPTENEPDGRFSEVLRGASKPDAKQPDVSADRKPEQAASSDGPARSETEVSANIQAPVELPADPASPAVPTAAHIGPNLLAIDPEAVTLARPDRVLPVFGDTEGPGSQAGNSPPPTPNSGNSIVVPQAPPPVPDTIGTPVLVRPADTAIRGPQPNGPAIPANPAVGANLASPETATKPGTPDATARVTQQSPTAATQSASGGPVMPAAQAIAGDAVASKSVPKPSVTQPKADAMDEAISDRPSPAATPGPARPATTRPAAPNLALPPDSSDTPEPPETAESKVASQPIRALPNNTAVVTSAATTATAATMPAGSKPGAVATTSAVPPTVSEIADAPSPASQTALSPATAMTSAQAGPAPAITSSATEITHSQATTQAVSEQVVLQVRRAVREGVDRLTVQLKPASLGRVDVQMEVGHDGRVQAIISAERPETLQLLQRDARALSEALNDAGLQTDSGSLSFNLRGQSGDHAGGDSRAPSDAARTERSNTADDIDQATTQITLTLGDGRVDIKV